MTNKGIIFLLFLSCFFNSLVNATNTTTDASSQDEGLLLPSIQHASSEPRVFLQGDDALLTCVVKNVGRHIVSWNKNVDGRSSLIAMERVVAVNDDRFSILHDSGGDVYVLSVKNVTTADTGVYECQVNTHVPLRAIITVVECCIQHGIKAECLGFCAISNILEGSTGVKAEKCEDQFPNIVKCMADFKDHVPCCERQRVPDICQDLCRGDYTIQEDSVKAHFSCSAFTEPALICISEGVEIIPGPPESPSVQVLGPNSFSVQWEAPSRGPMPQFYVVNVTTLKEFDPAVDIEKESPDYGLDISGADSLRPKPKRIQVKVPANQTSVQLNQLSPLTWYEVSVISTNIHGSSLPVYRLRTLTMPSDAQPVNVVHPELPNIIDCCLDKGIKHQRCLNSMCNPKTKHWSQPDMIVCAPWAQETFSCLTDGMDHSDCCRSRGLPDLCVELCSGNVTQIDYNYFKCLDFLSDFRSCLLKGYGVLPGQPLNIKITNINPDNALLTWNRPKQLGSSVTAYHAYFRPVEPDLSCNYKWLRQGASAVYKGIYTENTAAIIERLCPETLYEVYIQSFNTHGTGDPSDILLFRTASQKQKSWKISNVYNVTNCCFLLNVSPGCIPLCDYDARMSHVKALALTCTAEAPSIMRCAVGGRNHQSCCTRRGVPGNCMKYCTGFSSSEDGPPSQCIPYIGNIITCLEEGARTIPGPVESLHATEVRDGGVTLIWQAPSVGSNATYYEVHYQEADEKSAVSAKYILNNVTNATDTVITIDDLKVGGLYSFFVVSLNDDGQSLPSSVITVNLTKAGKTIVAGVPSSPHSLEIDSKTATSLTVLWQAPEIVHPTDRVRYIVHYRAVSPPNDTEIFNKTETAVTALRLEALAPNTQYVIYIIAVSDLGESRPSETMLAWTDPAYPAFVETPTVHPINMVKEGGSMTVLCIAMGSPPPTVSLYIAGILVHQDVTRHMVTVVNDIKRNMTEISCYADNGYGTPMQATRTITISRAPMIDSQEEVTVRSTDEVSLYCEVDAWPKPSITWWRDPDQRIPIIHGGNTAIINEEKTDGKTLMTLTIKNASRSDSDAYYCSADNPFGHSTKAIKLNVIGPVTVEVDALACCIKHNVSAKCIDACDFESLNFDRVMDREDCIPDFAKLMKCASDGSDHRSCCSDAEVPSACLNWCRGEEVESHAECLFQWAPVIFTCFSEEQALLPGPPQNVRISSLNDRAAEVMWDPPIKNPNAVRLYRVFWREKGTLRAYKNDTRGRRMTLTNLKDGLTYEIAIKAGNHRGTSVLTKTFLFNHTDPYKSPYSRAAGGSQVQNAVGFAFLILILGSSVGLGLWWLWRKRSLANKANGSGISFENPSYIREQGIGGGDSVQIAETPNGSLNGSVSTNGDVNADVTVWSTQAATPSTPGFEDGIPSNGRYQRFTS